MKVKLADTFVHKLNMQIEFISKDKPQAARKFKGEVLSLVKKLKDKPLSHRKSIYFDDASIRDAIFKGYKIVYKVNKSTNEIIVFGFVNEEEMLK